MADHLHPALDAEGSRADAGDYESVLIHAGILTSSRSVWAFAGHAEGEYGWKLHLSATQSTAMALLDKVLPILSSGQIPFKVARNAELLGMLNEGALAAMQVGKFMTVYPTQAEDDINRLATALIAATQGLNGPKVRTDLHLGSVVYARYGSFSPAMKRDRLGLFTPVDLSGSHEYKIPFTAPEGIANPFAGRAKCAPDAPEGIGPIGPGYLVTGLIRPHAKGSVLTAIDVRRQETVRRVVLKAGRPHCLSDNFGREMWFRLRNQFRAHSDLAHTGVVPRVEEPFEHDGCLYLPIEHVEGRDLGARPALPFQALSVAEQQKLLADLQSIIGAIRRIHDAGYAHRDLSMNNIRVTPSGAVMLLDFEISARVSASGAPPLAQGTAGFVSPQQLAGQQASLADDLFAFGAVLICLVTGLDPQRVLYANAADRADQIAALSGAPAALCALAAACVDPDPKARPSARGIQDATQQIVRQFELECVATISTPPVALRQIVSDGLRWLIQGAVREPRSGMWVSPDLASGEHASLKLVSNYRLYRSANRGVAGVLYTLAKLYRFGFRTEGMKEQVEHAVDWLLEHHDTPDDQMPGLHFGEAGVAVAVAEAVAGGLIDAGPWLQPYIEQALSGPLDWPDLTHGAAGQGMAAIICSQLLGEPALLQRAERCARYLLSTQAGDGGWVLPEGVQAMSGSVYTGFAHGVAGNVAFLATYARLASADDACAAAVRGGEWLLDGARSGPLGVSLWWPLTLDGHEAWAWWCHGAPGIALGLLALHQLTGERRYAAAVRACLRGHAEDVRYPNMSQCHGLSGLGEILLQAHHVLGEDEWLHRAEKLCTLLSHLARREPKGASWLAENPYQPTPDLMIGSGGIVHFLARVSLADARFGMPLYPAL